MIEIPARSTIYIYLFWNVYCIITDENICNKHMYTYANVCNCPQCIEHRVRGFTKPKWLCGSVTPAGISTYIYATLDSRLDCFPYFSIFVLLEIFFLNNAYVDSQWNGKEREVLKAPKSVCERKFRDYKKIHGLWRFNFVTKRCRAIFIFRITRWFVRQNVTVRRLECRTRL